MNAVETLLAVLKEHRRNDVLAAPAAPDASWRVKCDGDSCAFYAERSTWFEVCAAHEEHLAAVQVVALREWLTSYKTVTTAHDGTVGVERADLYDALTAVADLMVGEPDG